jgi:hypothetical protein
MLFLLAQSGLMMTVFATVVSIPTERELVARRAKNSESFCQKRKLRTSRQITQRSQQWLRWYEGLENAEGISVTGLPDEVQKGLKAVVREIRKLEEVANQG